MKNIKILKVGGSVMTFKDKDSLLNEKVIENIADDISKWFFENKDRKLIFTSGAGSFGHPLAHKYDLNSKDKNKSSLGFVLTTTNMQLMANKVAKIFHHYNLPLFPIMPSSIFELNKGRISGYYISNISKSLDRGLIPFLWGDTVIDQAYKFAILSGDQINPFLVKQLGINELYFGTNVDGVYDSDPVINPKAVHVDEINNKNYKSILKMISGSSSTDVTKGMLGKIEEIYQIKVRPLKCVIFNALVKESVYKALNGKDVGTKIIFSN
jgi:isopentenyl phosphate kinase